MIPDLTVQENIEVVSDISKNPLDIEEVMTALDIENTEIVFQKNFQADNSREPQLQEH